MIAPAAQPMMAPTKKNQIPMRMPMTQPIIWPTPTKGKNPCTWRTPGTGADAGVSVNSVPVLSSAGVMLNICPVWACTVVGAIPTTVQAQTGQMFNITPALDKTGTELTLTPASAPVPGVRQVQGFFPFVGVGQMIGCVIGILIGIWFFLVGAIIGCAAGAIIGEFVDWSFLSTGGGFPSVN